MIRIFDPSLEKSCRDFLERSDDALYTHDPVWADIIRESYGKEAFTLVSVDEQGRVQGLAPACYMRAPGLGRNIVSLPYLDYGGILAMDAQTEIALREKLLVEAKSRKAKLEIRSLPALIGLPEPENIKVAMLLNLDKTPTAADLYWKSLDAKVRNQVRKAEKSQVQVFWGGLERLDDFYRVFCVNMRDLGSPTHSRLFFETILKHLPGAQIGTAHRAGRCIGGLFRILWKDALVIPWASTLKEERVHCANNALYWESIRYAFEKKCRLVDFGRSSKHEGTYKFKQQWLAQEKPLHWYPFDALGQVMETVNHVGSGKLGWTRAIWTRLPLPIANALGPRLRGYISA